MPAQVCNHFALRLFLACCLLLSTQAVLFAQEDQPMPPEPQPPETQSEHIIYIPYSKLTEVFETDQRKVLLPIKEYEKLLEQLRKLGTDLTKPPVDAVISSIAYQGSVEKEVVSVQATLMIEVLQEGWVSVPVHFKGAAISKVDGAMLKPLDDGKAELLLNKLGQQQVVVDLVIPLVKGETGPTLSLDGPLAGSVRLDLTIPETGLDINVQPKLAATQIKTQDKTTQITSVLGAVDQVQVSWQPKTEGVVFEEALVVARQQSRISVGNGVIQTSSTIDYDILRGKVEELSFTLPPGESLLDVQTRGLRDWKIAEQDGGTQLVTVRLFSAKKGSVSLSVDTERPLSNEPFSVKPVIPQKVQRSTGILVLVSSEELSLNEVERENVTRIMGDQEVPEKLRREGAMYYKYYSQDYQLQVQAVPVSARVAVVNKMRFELKEGELRGNVDLVYDIQRAGIFSTRIKLPKDIQLQKVSGPMVERHEEAETADARVITVQFKQQVMGSTVIQLGLRQRRPDANADLVLPLPEPLDVATEQGAVVLLAHESFEVNTIEDQTSGVRPASTTELSQLGLSVSSTQQMPLAGSFRYLTRPISIAFSVKKRKTRIVAETFSLVEVKENAVRTTSTIIYNVQYAGTNTFTFQVPEDISKEVEITGSNIKEKRSSEPKEGMVTWTVLLHTNQLGKHPLTVNYELPLQLQGDGTPSASHTQQFPQPTGVDREVGKVVVTKQAELALSATAQGAEPIPPRLLEIPPEAGVSTNLENIQFTYRYYRHPVEVNLTIKKYEIQKVVETIVTRAFIETVVPEEGDFTYRVQYQIKSSQRQFLMMLLPSGSRFLGLSVAGKNVAPEKTEVPQGFSEVDAYLVNVSRPGEVTEPFYLSIVYEQPRPDEELAYLDNISMTMPQFPGDVTYQRIFWQVWLPRRYIPTSVPPGFTDENYQGRFGLLGVTSSTPHDATLRQWQNAWDRQATTMGFEFPTVGEPYLYSTLVGPPQQSATMTLEYGYFPAMQTIASAGAVLLILILLIFRTPTNISLLLFVALGIVGLGLYLPETTYRWVNAAGIGLVIGVIFAILRNLMLWRQQSLAAWQAQQQREADMYHRVSEKLATEKKGETASSPSQEEAVEFKEEPTDAPASAETSGSADAPEQSEQQKGEGQ